MKVLEYLGMRALLRAIINQGPQGRVGSVKSLWLHLAGISGGINSQAQKNAGTTGLSVPAPCQGFWAQEPWKLLREKPQLCDEATACAGKVTENSL